MTALVRTASLGDASAIGEVSVLAWQGAYRGILPDGYLDALDPLERAGRWVNTLRTPPPRSEVLVVQEATQVVGFAAIGPCREDSTIGELYAINLRPDNWARGVGTVLIEAAMQRLRRFGFEVAVLWVIPANQRARRFYEARGWHADNVERHQEVNDIVVPEIRYRTGL